jgi:hypothetical protein
MGLVGRRRRSGVEDDGDADASGMEREERREDGSVGYSATDRRR